jgi:hypothetical protein
MSTAMLQRTYSVAPPTIAPTRISPDATRFILAKLHTPATDHLAACM